MYILYITQTQVGCFGFYPPTKGWRKRRKANFVPHTHPSARPQGGALTRAYMHTCIHAYIHTYKHTYKPTNIDMN